MVKTLFLPAIGMEASVIGFGCDKIGEALNFRDSCELLELSFSNGINYFDTAPPYGLGTSEKILGRFLKNKRSQVVVATKFGLLPPSFPVIKSKLKPLARRFFELVPRAKPSYANPIYSSMSARRQYFSK